MSDLPDVRPHRDHQDRNTADHADHDRTHDQDNRGDTPDPSPRAPTAGWRRPAVCAVRGASSRTGPGHTCASGLSHTPNAPAKVANSTINGSISAGSKPLRGAPARRVA